MLFASPLTVLVARAFLSTNIFKDTYARWVFLVFEDALLFVACAKLVAPSLRVFQTNWGALTSCLKALVANKQALAWRHKRVRTDDPAMVNIFERSALDCRDWDATPELGTPPVVSAHYPRLTRCGEAFITSNLAFATWAVTFLGAVYKRRICR